MELTFFSTIILGFVQGLTEFLPISSSGHLMLVPYLFDFSDPGIAFSVALHVGTLLAVVLYFFRDWLNIFGIRKNMPIYRDRKVLYMLIVGTLPAVVVGFFLKDIAETLVRSQLAIVGMIFLGGIFLYISDMFFQKSRDMEEMTIKDALLIGVAQVFALVPGISRSGITIATARMLQISRVDAARFSFLLATPIIFGAGIVQFADLGISSITWLFWVGIMVSFISALLTIHFFLKLLQRISYAVFFWYSAVLVVIIVVVTIK